MVDEVRASCEDYKSLVERIFERHYEEESDRSIERILTGLFKMHSQIIEAINHFYDECSTRPWKG